VQIVQLNRTKFNNEEKKLKRHHEEQRMLEKILVHIKQCNSYNELINNPISKMYGFEPLKYDLIGY